MKNYLSLAEEEITTSVKILSKLLANTYLLSLKAQNYHWNVKDSYFSSRHEFFSYQYEEIGKAIDEIAERIRILGHRSPASFGEFLKITSLEEDTQVKSGLDMLKSLLKDHQIIISELRAHLKVLDNFSDEGTIDLLVGRLSTHEKLAWMLNSHLEIISE